MCAEKGVKARCADDDSKEDVSLMLGGTPSSKAVTAHRAQTGASARISEKMGRPGNC